MSLFLFPTSLWEKAPLLLSCRCALPLFVHVPGIFLEPLEFSHGYCRCFTAQDALLTNWDTCVLGFGDIGRVCGGVEHNVVPWERWEVHSGWPEPSFPVRQPWISEELRVRKYLQHPNLAFQPSNPSKVHDSLLPETPKFTERFSGQKEPRVDPAFYWVY